jgi:hypothetical protein
LAATGLPVEFASEEPVVVERREHVDDSLAFEAETGRVGTFETSPGFTPDPLVHEGTTSGGPIDASQIDERCTGFVGHEPDFVFTARRPFAELAVMAASERDTTLIVVGPDGETRCSDDVEGTHPIVRALFEPGTYRVWVGTAERGTSARFVFALSELDGSLPSNLLH